jgi:acyl-CoA synthetase (NDP forming)
LVQDYLPPGINELNKYYLYDAKAFFEASQKLNLPSIICSTVPENNDPEISDFFVSNKVSPLQGLEEALNAVKRSYKFNQRYQDYLDGKVSVKKSTTNSLKSSLMLNEIESKSILKKIGLKIPSFLNEKNYFKANNSDGQNFKLNFPVCAKMISNNVEHKTDIGAIELNINSLNELNTALKNIKINVKNAKINFTDDFLVEEMQPSPIGELLVGIFYDQQFGYIMTIASGGILANLLKDSISILLPASSDEINISLKKLKINKLFSGYRGKKEINRELLLNNLKKLSDFVIDPNNKIQQLEINPLFVFEENNVAVDAIIWKSK